MATRRELADMIAALLLGIQQRKIDPGGALCEAGGEMVRRVRDGVTAEVPWTPFQRATALGSVPGFDECWVNSRYQVLVRRHDESVWLSIKRIDQAQARSWRDLQRIKDELVGPECEAVELYPARSRLVDQSNQYHLWAVADPTYRFPVGWNEGTALATPDEAAVVGAMQAAFDTALTIEP